MRTVFTQRDFVARMAETLSEEINEQNPSSDQLLRYFRSFSNDSQAAINAYEDYASLYHIHVGQSSDPNATVTYPGGAGIGTCDNFSEVLARSVENGMHVIDCRGFAVMAVILLREAGFRSPQYMIAVPPSATQPGNWQGHIFVRLTHSSSGQVIYVGNNHVHDSPAGAVEGLAGWSPDDEVNVLYGIGDTYQESVEHADEIVQRRHDAPLSDVRVIDPLRGRHTFSPPVREE